MSVFETLNAINVNDHKEGKNGLTYLSWVWAISELLKNYPDATYEVVKFDGLPYVYDEETGYMVYTTMTIEGVTREMWLPVMDSKNKAMKSHEYTYVDSYGKERKVEKASMFDINKTIMRCLTKNMAMFGLGLYIYAGEDLPEGEKEEPKAEKISNKEATILKATLEKKNINIGKLCEQYKAKSLEDLTSVQYSDILTRINNG